MITPENRFQITHATRAVFGEGAFVIFDVTGAIDSVVAYNWQDACDIRDDMRWRPRPQLELIQGGKS